MVNAACGASLSRTESDDVLDGIQKKIELAMNNCFVQNTAAPLDSLFTKLNKLEDGNGMVPYWKAYITYYKSVFYLKLGKKEDSGKVIKEASAILNDIGNKTSETYALLALVQSFPFSLLRVWRQEEYLLAFGKMLERLWNWTLPM